MINEYGQLGNYMKNILFWNVDTQYDFMRDDKEFKGSLSVADAKDIEENLSLLTIAAKFNNIQVINTADYHTMKDEEINAVNPDFKKTYPPHCMRGTKGAEYVPATNPESPYVIDWMDESFNEKKLTGYRNIVLYKNHFNVFEGNKHADKVVELLNPETVMVYGVATNVCVNFAVQSLLDRKKEVYVITDAIKELPKEVAAKPLEKILDEWTAKGAKYMTTNQLWNILNVGYQ